MELIVTERFVDGLEELRIKAFQEVDDDLSRKVLSIRGLITADLPVRTSVPASDNFHESAPGVKVKTIKQYLAYRRFKNPDACKPITENGLQKADCKDVLLIDKDFQRPPNNGYLSLNIDDPNLKFPWDSNFTHLTFQRQYQVLERDLAKGSSMLYVDPYLLAFWNKVELTKKYQAFLKFVNANNARVDGLKFHLTILTIKPENLQMDDAEYSIQHLGELIKALANIDFEVVVCSRLYYFEYRDKYRDRIFFTNTCMGSFGHPNESKTTYFNCQVMAIQGNPGKVEKGYSDYRQGLLNWKKLMNDHPNELFYHSNVRGFANRIFEGVK